jgi:hypothetical protein
MLLLDLGEERCPSETASRTWMTLFSKPRLLQRSTSTSPIRSPVRCLAISWAQSSGTSLGGTMGHDNLTCNANYLKDNTFRCRIIHGKRARTSSAGLTQLATRKEEKFEQATATDGSD